MKYIYEFVFNAEYEYGELGVLFENFEDAKDFAICTANNESLEILVNSPYRDKELKAEDFTIVEVDIDKVKNEDNAVAIFDYWHSSCNEFTYERGYIFKHKVK